MLVNDFPTVNDFLSCQHHSAGNGNRAEHVVSLGLGTFLVVNQVRLYIVHQVTPLQGLPVRSQFLVGKQLFVGREGGIQTGNLSTQCSLSIYHAHHVHCVLGKLRIFGGTYDSCLIEPVQPVKDSAHIVGRNPGNARLEVVGQPCCLQGSHFFLIIIIRFEVFRQTVLLGLDGLVGLIDGEVEVGYQRRIHPWLLHVVAELGSAVTRQEPHDDDDTGDNQRDTCYHVAPVRREHILVSCHCFLRVFGFYSAKLRKNLA